MIDLPNVFKLKDLPDVLVFPDDQNPGGFYALSQHPRIAQTDDGVYQISLTLYGKRVNEAFQPMGGLMACTTSLGLTQTEQDTLSATLKQLLAQQAEVLGKPPAPFQRLSLNWQAGEVRLRLTPQIEWKGQPALFGDNPCVFSQNLTAQDATQIKQAWEEAAQQQTSTSQTNAPPNDTEKTQLENPPQDAIRYELEIPQPAQATSAFVFDQSVDVQTQDSHSQQRLSARILQTGRSPGTVRLTLAGPLFHQAPIEEALRQIDLGS